MGRSDLASRLNNHVPSFGLIDCRRKGNTMPIDFCNRIGLKRLSRTRKLLKHFRGVHTLI